MRRLTASHTRFGRPLKLRARCCFDANQWLRNAQRRHGRITKLAELQVLDAQSGPAQRDHLAVGKGDR
jgi:hypothetical protein